MILQKSTIISFVLFTFNMRLLFPHHATKLSVLYSVSCPFHGLLQCHFSWMFQIQFKMILMTKKALNGHAPSYLIDVVFPNQPPRALRSQSTGLLTVPRVSKSRMGEIFVYNLLSCGTSCQSGCETLTLSCLLSLNLRPSFLKESVVDLI